MKIREAIIVEGKYDLIKLDSICDALIIKSDGFKVFKDREKLDYIRRLASERGIVVLTDSDRAGFIIRGFIRGSVQGRVLHAYIPDVRGREKRKKNPSKEGLLGVEGIDAKTILDALRAAGCTFEGEENECNTVRAEISRTRLFTDGLIGCADSRACRERFLLEAGLPSKMSSSELLRVINSHLGYDKYEEIITKIRGDVKKVRPQKAGNLKQMN